MGGRGTRDASRPHTMNPHLVGLLLCTLNALWGAAVGKKAAKAPLSHSLSPAARGFLRAQVPLLVSPARKPHEVL